MGDKMSHKIIKISFLIALISFYLTYLHVTSVQAEEIIYGEYCYTYGDRESFIEAKQLTRTLAIRNAIESYRSYINATTEVKNFTLTNDIVQMISSGYMKNISVVSRSENGREICERIQATVSPRAIEEAIKREVQSRTKTVETQGIDNNGVIKILNIRYVVGNDPYNPYLNKPHIEVTVKALKKNNDPVSMFIEYYDKDGNAIGGGKCLVFRLSTDEIKTFEFGSPIDNIPVGTTHYKVRLEKSDKFSEPKQPSSKRTKSIK
jgi:hypothetical protein